MNAYVGVFFKTLFVGLIASSLMLPPPVLAVDSTFTPPTSRTHKSVRTYLLDQGVTDRIPMNGSFIINRACPSGYLPVITGTLNRSGGWHSDDDEDYIVGWGINWINGTTTRLPNANGSGGETRVSHSAYTWYQDGHGNESWGGIVWQLWCQPT